MKTTTAGERPKYAGIIFLVSCFLFSYATASQNTGTSLSFFDLGFLPYDKESEAYDAVKDKNGYYWLGTASGLKRYDGKNLIGITTRNNEALFREPVEYLKIQGDYLWIGGPKGLYQLNLENYEATRFPALNNKYIMRISLGKNNNVWIGTLKSGLYRYQQKTKTFIRAKLPAGSSKGRVTPSVRSVATMADGVSWIVSESGLLAYDSNHSLYIDKKDYPSTWSSYLGKFASLSTQDVMTSKSGNLLVSYLTELYEFDQKYAFVKKISLPCEDIPRCELNSLASDNNDRLWGRLGTRKLLEIGKDRSTFKIHTIKNEQGSAAPISDFNISNDNILTVSAYDQSIVAARLDSSLRKVISLAEHNPLLSSFSPRLKYQDQRGDLWMADREWIVVYQPSTNKILSFKSPTSTISSLVVDSNFKVWIISALDHFLFRLDPETGLFDKPIEGKFYLLEYSKKDGLWLGGENIQLYKADINSLILEGVKDSPCLASVSWGSPSIVDNELLAWYDNDDLCKYDRISNAFLKTKITFTKSQDPSGKLYYSDGKYWSFQPHAQKLIPHSSSFHKGPTLSSVESIMEPASSDGVVAGKQEIWFLNRKRNRLYQLDTTTYQSNHYNFSEGIPRDTNSMLLGVDQQGLLVISEPGLIASYHTQNLRNLPVNDTIKVHSISISHKDGSERNYYYNKNIVLSNKEFSVELVFGNTRPKLNLSNHVFYRLKGHEDSWIKTKRDFVRFSGLSSGQYSFQMKPALNSKEIVSLNIEVEAPLWFRWWAYLVYASIISAVVLIIAYQRFSHIRELRLLANYDSLTGLPNKNFIGNHLLTLTKSNTDFSLLFIDLDRFKNINDSLGHHVGDQLLIAVTSRFKSCLGSSDLISRLGGDEFLVVIPGSQEYSTLSSSTVAARLLATVSNAIEIEHKSLHVSLSIGIAMYPNDGKDTQMLLSSADAAMYDSKARGGNCYSFYTKELFKASLKALNLESELYRSVKNQDFLPYYQPKVNIATGNCVGYEVLIRWLNPGKGIIEPDNFISTAERTGLIIEISWQIMHMACKQTELWTESGLELPLALNVSPLQLSLPKFSELALEIISQYAIDPKLIQFEVTEGMLLIDKEHSIKQLTMLKEKGHKIYVDDFGTGYSSLSYLKDLPIDALKVDQFFVRDVLSDENSKNIVTSITYLARKMNLELVAEGIEDLATAEYLLSLGCRVAQGFYYSRPLPPNEIEFHSINNALRKVNY